MSDPFTEADVTIIAERTCLTEGIVRDVLAELPKIDAIMADGAHRYWSTHCRHGDHEACSATEIVGVGGSTVRGVRQQRVYLTTPVTVARKPAQCKTCAAPCVCPCGHGQEPPAVWEADEEYVPFRPTTDGGV